MYVTKKVNANSTMCTLELMIKPVMDLSNIINCRSELEFVLNEMRYSWCGLENTLKLFVIITYYFSVRVGYSRLLASPPWCFAVADACYYYDDSLPNCGRSIIVHKQVVRCLLGAVSD